MADTRGSCLCGSVRWVAHDTLEKMDHCHCQMCRKAHGAAFATFVPSKDFEWTHGHEHIRHYAASTALTRAFCGTCGSALPVALGGRRYAMPAGCLDDDPGVRPLYNIFAASAPKWSHLPTGIGNHDTYPDPANDPDVAPRALPPATEAVLRGSCLCDAVAFEVTQPIKVVHNCHCSRCRKARAAAHTTNGFTSADGVRFVRGEELVTHFKLPDAKFFTHAFCSQCGSGTARISADRGIAMVPYGALDDEPDVLPVDHIFTGSKAPWFEVTDELPQFEAMPTS